MGFDNVNVRASIGKVIEDIEDQIYAGDLEHRRFTTGVFCDNMKELLSTIVTTQSYNSMKDKLYEYSIMLAVQAILLADTVRDRK